VRTPTNVNVSNLEETRSVRETKDALVGYPVEIVPNIIWCDRMKDAAFIGDTR
jgi:hypothetical protein